MEKYPVKLELQCDHNSKVDDFKNQTIIPVILCGGAGSRLWPVSRELHPTN